MTDSTLGLLGSPAMSYVLSEAGPKGSTPVPSVIFALLVPQAREMWRQLGR